METVDDLRLYSGRYQVTHLIARGGMAIVYRAHDTLLNRFVALKILYPELSADPLFVERFRREAQAAANLSHPNIVPVFDWGEDDGTYFIVMELVDGTSLAEVLRDGHTVTPSRTAQIGAQVAAALGYAHRSGVVHRDVKPGNILLTAEGQVKVTDFGIAQAVSSDDFLAAEGSVMGTATYFSPEQAEGVAVDGRSDVYALGVVLYEMLAGRPPFVGETPVEVSRQHVHGQVPPLGDVAASVPRDLAAIVMRSLAKAPAQRYPSADEMRADLIRFSEGEPVSAVAGGGAFFGADATRAVAAVPGEHTQAVPVMSGPRTDVRRRRRGGSGPWVVALVVVVLLGGLGLYYYESQKSVNINVPDLIGESLTRAQAKLVSEGLTLGQTTYAVSAKPKNTVLATTPAPGTVLTKGEAVSLKLSKGQAAKTVTVPDVSNQSLSSAESTLSHYGLAFDAVATTNNPGGKSQPNVVLYQSPSSGTTLHVGDKVTIYYLAPGTQYSVDDVTGDVVVEATSVLTGQGLVVSPNLSYACSNTIARARVVSTNPPSGSLVNSGTTVKLVVSSGYCNVVVPTVVNDTEPEATTALEQYGLQPSFQLDPTGAICPPGSPQTVTQQPNNPGGSSAKYGSTIVLYVCSTSGT